MNEKESYIKVGGELNPGDYACFQTRDSSCKTRDNKKGDIEITGIWDGEKFTSVERYGSTVETVVRNKEWLTKINF
jgi:NAD(P)H-dependent flavin oxidoreductase YrpB (nitropropane dioxygenase family)